MAAPPRNVARTKKATAHEAAPSTAATPGSDQTPRPEGSSSGGHRISDDAAGDEGIDEPTKGG